MNRAALSSYASHRRMTSFVEENCIVYYSSDDNNSRLVLTRSDWVRLEQRDSFGKWVSRARGRLENLTTDSNGKLRGLKP